MPDLVAVQLPGGDAFLDALRRIWDAGDAVLPLDPSAPPAHTSAILEANRPARLVGTTGTNSLPGSVPVLEGDALVIATSGTTGDPKGVIHTVEAVQAAAHMSTVATGVDSDVRWLACLPLWHVGGFSVVSRAIVAGLGLEIHPGFDAAAVDDAARRGATHVSLVPTAVARIDTGLWRRILLGGSAIPEQRPSNVTATYGMTETLGGVVYDGQALPGVSVRVIDSDRTDLESTALEAPTGTEGLIEVRSPTLLRGYRNDTDPEGTDPVGRDGWLRTGDMGSIGPDGRLRVSGRADDVINTGGEKVWPTTVEAVLDAHDDVGESAVVGLMDPEWGQRVVAVVVPRDPDSPPDLGELRDAVRAELPAYCAPKQLLVTDSLPRTGLGKLRRSEIVSHYTESGIHG